MQEEHSWGHNRTCTVCNLVAPGYYTLGLEYALSSDRTYYKLLNGGTSNVKNLVIPDKINNLPVKEIAANAFSGKSSIESVVLPESIVTIGSNAFKGTSIKNLIIPSSVTSIATGAFADIPELEFVIISSRSNVLNIANSAFTKSLNVAESGIEKAIYYEGTSAADWQSKVKVGTGNEILLNSAFIYYYSAKQPTSEGNYWYYEAFTSPVKWN